MPNDEFDTVIGALAGPVPANADAVRTLIEESQLFIEAAHSCYQRLTEAAVAAAE